MQVYLSALKDGMILFYAKAKICNAYQADDCYHFYDFLYYSADDPPEVKCNYEPSGGGFYYLSGDTLNTRPLRESIVKKHADIVIQIVLEIP